ncbi:alpha-D-ribose 1-methylphosphonate 5-triphosphate diphosphatase [Roseomonas xinghualingensis]|uniref:alpha-D-ribose 1-methylphosphonate 5-triphosphate diphosphatase n=1 Tax=Roseomonas xinghualingensis TaxID=2986475 RepID=UPI0021F0E50A|nr:alpha-D-ribose 1-methylphosphonate 5-triphosphate diphosphatase [Roseomonas sp. SXEYE001]MCV4208619.1 alpha-D-ribose 1-methylphosphonate 5-triphosphate diphosphatase [Roseomonas sp. SXEYE001]
MSNETILTNARLVLPDRVETGTVLLRGGLIAEISPGRSAAPGAQDLGGDHLIPGAVDVHTDNLERQVLPRSMARWPSASAFLSHDSQVAVAGVTTVLDALCLGDLGFDESRLRTAREGVRDLTALTEAGVLKTDHLLHLRCELPARDMLSMLEEYHTHPLLRMVSLMDHTPGVGQYIDANRYRTMRVRTGEEPEAVERRMVELAAQRETVGQPNRRALLALFAGRDVPLATHDDWDARIVAENAADGIRISEFPVNLEAARAARAHGMAIIAGAPNLVRGGSHSGNVSAAALARAGLVDIIASDYVPPAMIEAAWRLVPEAGMSLPAAVATITANPAEALGLADRGRIAPGLRADLVRVREFEAIPMVLSVWRGGERIA